MRTYIVRVLAVFFLLSGNVLASEVVNCPTSESGAKIVKIPSMLQTSVAIEAANDKSSPVTLTTYRSIGNGKCDKHIFAKYSVEGGNPNVDSLFFYEIDNKLNILTIVHWDINIRGIGAYGKLYQVYAYEIGKNNQFQENGSITDNNAMTGIDRYDYGRQSNFSLKTAKDVKKL